MSEIRLYSMRTFFGDGLNCRLKPATALHTHAILVRCSSTWCAFCKQWALHGRRRGILRVGSVHEAAAQDIATRTDDQINTRICDKTTLQRSNRRETATVPAPLCLAAAAPPHTPGCIRHRDHRNRRHVSSLAICLQCGRVCNAMPPRMKAFQTTKERPFTEVETRSPERIQTLVQPCPTELAGRPLSTRHPLFLF